MVEKGKSLSLMQKMMIWFILIILLPSCVLSLVLYRTLTDRAYDLLVEDNCAVLNIARESIGRSAASVENMVEMVSLDTDLNKLLSDRRQTQYQRVVKILYEVNELIAQTQLMLSEMDARLSVYFSDAAIPETYWTLMKLERLEGSEDYAAFLRTGETKGWAGVDYVYPLETTLRPAGNQRMLCYYQKVLAGIGECMGVIRCGVSPDKIFAPLQLENIADAYYVLQDGNVIYHSDGAEELPAEYCDGSDRQIIRQKLYLSGAVETMGLSIVMRLDYGALHSQALASGLVPFLTAVGSGILLLVATCTFLRSIQKRLDQAVNYAQNVKAGSMEIAFPNPGGDEVGRLINAFNALLERLQQNSQRMIAHERNEKYAMRLALQYQINPHFLFNSLNWIQMSAELGVSRDQLSEAVLLLGKLLRNNLQGNDMTTLEDEMQCARDYVRLMNMRKQDPIALQFRIAALPDDLPVMRLLFQPLCENAIQHGMEMGKPLRITIDGEQRGEMIWLAVENDGAMIPPEKLEALRVQTRHTPDGHGIGLANLSSRLRLLYGASAQIDIESNRRYTRITLRFPPHTLEETDAQREA